MSVTPYPAGSSGSTDSFSDGYIVTPSDTEDLQIIPRGIHLNEDGTVKMDIGSLVGVSIFFIGGISHPYRPRKIYATGTDNVQIYAGY